MRCPAGCLASSTREAPGSGPPPSACRSCGRELAGQNKKRQRPRRSGSLKSRGGAPRGERPTLLDARRLANACGSASSIREGCLASTRAPTGAPLPHGCGGKSQTSEELLPRENDGDCADARKIVGPQNRPFSGPNDRIDAVPLPNTSPLIRDIQRAMSKAACQAINRVLAGRVYQSRTKP
jgi:hypothetical protein